MLLYAYFNLFKSLFLIVLVIPRCPEYSRLDSVTCIGLVTDSLGIGIFPEILSILGSRVCFICSLTHRLFCSSCSAGISFLL